MLWQLLICLGIVHILPLRTRTLQNTLRQLCRNIPLGRLLPGTKEIQSLQTCCEVLCAIVSVGVQLCAQRVLLWDFLQLRRMLVLWIHGIHQGDR